MSMGLCKHGHRVLHLQFLKLRKWGSAGEEMLPQYFSNETCHHFVHIFLWGIHKSFIGVSTSSFHSLLRIVKGASISILVGLELVLVVLTHASKAGSKEEEVKLLIVSYQRSFQTSLLRLLLNCFRFHLLTLLFVPSRLEGCGLIWLIYRNVT